MNQPYEVAPDTYILPSHVTVPGVGILPNNAFVVLGDEPLLIDTGLRAESAEFLEALASLVDPADLAYVFLTHDDADHTGSIDRVLDLAPGARLLTHGLAALRIKLTSDIPLDRVRAVVAGDQVTVGGRTFHVFRPTLFDNPTTLGLYEPGTRTMFGADSFGAIVPRWEHEASAYSADELSRGLLLWASFDDPWVAHYDREEWKRMLQEAGRLETDIFLSSHLPPATGLFPQLIRTLESLPDVEPFVPPNQEAFEQIVAAMKAAVV
jgi:flavorubredoxin